MTLIRIWFVLTTKFTTIDETLIVETTFVLTMRLSSAFVLKYLLKQHVS